MGLAADSPYVRVPGLNPERQRVKNKRGRKFSKGSSKNPRARSNWHSHEQARSDAQGSNRWSRVSKTGKLKFMAKK